MCVLAWIMDGCVAAFLHLASWPLFLLRDVCWLLGLIENVSIAICKIFDIRLIPAPAAPPASAHCGDTHSLASPAPRTVAEFIDTVVLYT